MNRLRKTPESLDGQMKDRPWYCIPVDALRTDSTALFWLLVQATHHSLHRVHKKRAAMQVFLTNAPGGTILGFTGRTGFAEQLPSEIRDIPDFNASYLKDWNPLSAFLNAHIDKPKVGYLLHDKSPKAPMGPLTSTRRVSDMYSRTVLDELIEAIDVSPYYHFIVFTIRPKMYSGFDKEDPEDNGIIVRLIAKAINRYRYRTDASIDKEDTAYHLQANELIVYSPNQPRPSEPLIERLTDLSTSDHEYAFEKVRTELVADKMAYATVDYRRSLPKRLFYRTDGKKRTLDLLEEDMDRILQRRRKQK